MLSDTITLNDASSAAKTFTKTSQSGNESTRFDTSSTLGEPRLMVVRHQAVGKGSTTADRHNFAFSKRKNDSNGVPQTVSLSVVVTVPRDTSVASEVPDLVAFAENFLATSGVVTALLRGES
uniref:Uncharacterized protein n=1 Tax=Leviviridae sp. TaxID=2027243 RepID=A0A514D9G5_9VIRU|nr:MAG: hypothetical protein H4Rhizo44802_000002 [Leviviridae sp.]